MTGNFSFRHRTARAVPLKVGGIGREPSGKDRSGQEISASITGQLAPFPGKEVALIARRPVLPV